ncbi:S49 family peptidase [Planctomyces sp. SH-PL62]|uniref:S49 family peptidase n=1 Tax=Planctomyces sp. SH-PL62 TaxID=1636152 RepID=UPI00078D1555|nr:S49 family peptidase [Planctomyces sp. SH-PL62]AMV38767.1 Putative signal peptide peptidase SppA [Planctomyces sp. SH-PL62]
MRETVGEHRAAAIALIALIGLAGGTVGCATIPIQGLVETRTAFDGRVAATVEGPIKVEIPPATDPGPMVAVPVRAGRSAERIGIVDVDGLILNQNLAGLYSVGENPVAAFREKLEAAAADPSLRAVVLRINSPGGSVTASDILAEELRRFREATGRPVVVSLMDLATSGAYYVAVGGDRIIAHPTTVTGGMGALINHFNLQDASAQLNARSGAVKAGPKIEMGSYNGPLPDDDVELLQEMVDGFRGRFRERVAHHRKWMTPADFEAIDDGRVVAAEKALKLHMVDRLGYVHDALDEAESLVGIQGCEVVIFQRRGYPAHSLYAITPAPVDGGLVPFSLPGLDRAKLPTFLYLWQPDPTMLRLGGR